MQAVRCGGEGGEAVSEKRLMQQIMKRLSDAGARLFRNHVGVAFQGKATRFTEPTTVEVKPGDVLLRQARTVTSGLATGSSDLIGWTSRQITEYDLGKVIAQFTAVEVKTEDGVLAPEQRQFQEVVRDSGGVAIVAHSAEEAVAKLRTGE